VETAVSGQIGRHARLNTARRQAWLVKRQDNFLWQLYLRDALDALLAGQEPSVTKTRAVGCSIKWAGKLESIQAYMNALAAEPVLVSLADTNVLMDLRKNGSGKFRPVNFWGCGACRAWCNFMNLSPSTACIACAISSW
jgi:hypothetical protein